MPKTLENPQLYPARPPEILTAKEYKLINYYIDQLDQLLKANPELPATVTTLARAQDLVDFRLGLLAHPDQWVSQTEDFQNFLKSRFHLED